MDELYKEYGEKMIQLEILNSQINELKKKIAEAINKRQSGENDKLD